MYLKLLLLTVLLGLTTSLPTFKEEQLQKWKAMSRNSDGSTSRNSALEQTILEALEQLREVMLTGSDDIPILDPFNLDHLHVDDSTVAVPGLKLTLEDVEVRNLSTFVIDTVSVTSVGLLRYNIQLEGYIPELEADSDKYDLSVSISGFSVFGSGAAKIKVVEPRVKARLLIVGRLSIITGVSITADECEVEFGLTAFKSQLTGLFNDPFVSDFVSLFLEHFIPEALDLFEEEINDVLSTTVHEIANEVLSLVDIWDIIFG